MESQGDRMGSVSWPCPGSGDSPCPGQPWGVLMSPGQTCPFSSLAARPGVHCSIPRSLSLSGTSTEPEKPRHVWSIRELMGRAAGPLGELIKHPSPSSKPGWKQNDIHRAAQPQCQRGNVKQT